MNTASMMDYAGFCPKCGALCCCVVDDPEDRRYTAKTVAAWIREGLVVERVSRERIKAEFRGCQCKKAAMTQQEMF